MDFELTYSTPIGANPLDPPLLSTQPKAHVSATKVNEAGTKFTYIYNAGKETLHVVGPLPVNFDEEEIMNEFRQSLGLLGDCTDPTSVETEGEQSKSLLESVGEYFIGETFVSNVRQYYETIALTDELQRAREELDTTKEELSQAYTQHLILRRRQADLGAYIEESMKKFKEERNPTVEELVLTEDDRLALLDHRIKRIISKLKKQKTELERYVSMHDTITNSPTPTATFDTPATEHHIFTQNTQNIMVVGQQEREVDKEESDE